MTTENAHPEVKKVQLNDAELDEVTGGLEYTEYSGHYYMWCGNDSQSGEKYLCPRCGRPVHYGSAWRFYCDPCDCSWFYEENLVPNTGAGHWKEISASSYNQLTKPGTH